MSRTTVDLYWLPLGAGGHFVRLNGRIYEFVKAAVEHRDRCRLYHAALMIRRDDRTTVIEVTPVRGSDGPARGVVAGGPVGVRFLGRFSVFRYEVRAWPGGVIPDVVFAVDSPQRLTSDPQVAEKMLNLVQEVPTPVWGRDELHTGDMWNSNSVVAWLIVRGGLDVDAVSLPERGRAPGWNAGVAVARRPTLTRPGTPGTG